MKKSEKVKQYVVNLLKQELGKDYYYHSVEHTLDVYHSSSEMADLSDVSNYEKGLLLTAALLHDVGLIDQYENHEEASIVRATKTLPEFGYTLSEIDIISNMIRSTCIPQNPETKLEKILCDADLDYLGRDDFFMLAAKLQLEWKALNIRNISFDKWIEFEIEFLSNHQYFTQAAISRREDKKNENLLQLVNICSKK